MRRTHHTGGENADQSWLWKCHRKIWFSFFFLGLPLRPMEAPRLGVKWDGSGWPMSQPQQLQIRAASTATQDPYLLNPLSEARNQTCTLREALGPWPVEPQWELQEIVFKDASLHCESTSAWEILQGSPLPLTPSSSEEEKQEMQAEAGEGAVERNTVSLLCFFFRAAPVTYGSSQARPQPQKCQIWATSATYSTAHGNAGSLSHRVRPGINPPSSWILIIFLWFPLLPIELQEYHF